MRLVLGLFTVVVLAAGHAHACKRLATPEGVAAKNEREAKSPGPIPRELTVNRRVTKPGTAPSRSYELAATRMLLTPPEKLEARPGAVTFRKSDLKSK